LAKEKVWEREREREERRERKGNKERGWRRKGNCLAEIWPVRLA
jgi:hypothetical protein